MIDRARLGLTILRESPDDVTLMKPAGVASELTRDPRNESLIARLRLAVPPGVSPRLVHRLDRVTRGIMVVALARDAAAFHARQIRDGHWRKYYLARIPTPAPGTPQAQRLLGPHKAYIREGPERAELVRSGGKASLLDVLACHPAPDRPRESHALIRLHTGRLHQIRVMFWGFGLPLIGDSLYGGPPGPLYLEHCVLFHTDYASRTHVLAFQPDDPDRERLHPELNEALRRLVCTGNQ